MTAGVAGSQTELLVSSTADPGTPFESVTIDWGDGSAEQTINSPGSSSVNEEHTYSEPGTYVIVVEVVDEDGRVATQAVRVVIEEGSTAPGGTGTPSNAEFLEKLFDEDGVRLDNFGQSIAVDGNRAIIGAPGALSSQEMGAAYIFERTGEGWIETARLVPTAGQTNRFGNAVAISGDRVWIGANQDDTAAQDAGAVYEFTLSDAGWTSTETLTGMRAAARFGTSLQVFESSGSLQLFVGSAGLGQRVDVFVESDGVWQPSSAIESPAGTVGFAETLHFDGRRLFVGAPISDEVHVYTRGRLGWDLQTTLIPSDAANARQFGRSLATSGDYVFVGDPNYSGDVGRLSGSVSIFLETDGIWTERQQIVGSEELLHFGVDLLTVNELLLVGADWAGTNPRAENADGIVYGYLLEDGEWNPAFNLTPDDPQASQGFGFALATNGTELLVGSPRDETRPLTTNTATDTGSVYAYEFDVESVEPEPLPGDLGVPDGQVNFADFLILSNNFGRTNVTRAEGDIDGDGQVSFTDFLIFSQNFGRTID